MYNHRSKYRPIIYLISLFYVNFFFLSPFFYHHHSESENFKENSEITHLHLFGGFGGGAHSEDSDYHFEDENHHSRLVQDTCSYSTTPTRISRLILQINVYSSLVYSTVDPETFEIYKSTSEDFSQIQWDKRVHSATNVSPPRV